jgi:hypothetical protein
MLKKALLLSALVAVAPAFGAGAETNGGSAAATGSAAPAAAATSTTAQAPVVDGYATQAYNAVKGFVWPTTWTELGKNAAVVAVAAYIVKAGYNYAFPAEETENA